MRVITISREYGSGGGEIAVRLAQQLGWELGDHAVVERMAQELGIAPEEAEARDEHVEGLVVRMLATLQVVGPVPVELVPTPEAEDRAAMERIFQAAVAAGHAMMVRGGACASGGDRPLPRRGETGKHVTPRAGYRALTRPLPSLGAGRVHAEAVAPAVAGEGALRLCRWLLHDRPVDHERHVDVAPRGIRVGAALVRAQHQLLSLGPLHTWRVQVEGNRQAEAAVSGGADPHTRGDGRVRDVALPTARHTQQRGLEACGVAEGEELFGIGARPAVAVHLFGDGQVYGEPAIRGPAVPSSSAFDHCLRRVEDPHASCSLEVVPKTPNHVLTPRGVRTFLVSL